MCNAHNADNMALAGAEAAAFLSSINPGIAVAIFVPLVFPKRTATLSPLAPSGLAHRCRLGVYTPLMRRSSRVAPTR